MEVEKSTCAVGCGGTSDIGGGANPIRYSYLVRRSHRHQTQKNRRSRFPSLLPSKPAGVDEPVSLGSNMPLTPLIIGSPSSTPTSASSRFLRFHHSGNLYDCSTLSRPRQRNDYTANVHRPSSRNYATVGKARHIRRTLARQNRCPSVMHLGSTRTLVLLFLAKHCQRILPPL